jgi:hypothetical protein
VRNIFPALLIYRLYVSENTVIIVSNKFELLTVTSVRSSFICEPGRIRTCDFFSAIDEQVGEKGEKAVYYVYFVPKSPYNSLRSLHAVSAYLYPNCSRIVHAVYPICIGMKQGKATPSPALRGK